MCVDIAAEALAMVERLTRRRLPSDSSFWLTCAERTLTTYLWQEGRIPPHRLTVTQVTRHDVDRAARWEEP